MQFGYNNGIKKNKKVLYLRLDIVNIVVVGPLKRGGRGQIRKAIARKNSLNV